LTAARSSRGAAVLIRVIEMDALSVVVRPICDGWVVELGKLQRGLYLSDGIAEQVAKAEAACLARSSGRASVVVQDRNGSTRSRCIIRVAGNDEATN
jgi:hypothetical protein